MKILFIVNVPSPYRVDFFNELGKHCDLTVFFEKETSNERDSSWKDYRFDSFKGVFLPGKSIGTDTAVCTNVIKRLKADSFDRIIVGNFSSPTGMLAIRYFRKHRIPYYLEADGGFAKDGKGFKEKLKEYFIKGAAGYFSTGRFCDEYFVAYGADQNKLIRYPFTSLRRQDILSAPVSLQDKLALRQRLGIRESKIILTVGQFIHRKGFDILLRAVQSLSKDTGVYFIGGEPTEEYLSLVQELDLSNVHFIGFKSKPELAEYYQAADIFVLPTREDIWGLVIQEAMAYGLPVISTTRCIAADEMIMNGKNGYIVPVEDDASLAEAIRSLLTSDLSAFSRSSLEIIQGYTIEAMAQKHLEALE